MPDIRFDDGTDGAAYTNNNSVGLTYATSAAIHGALGLLTPSTAAVGRSRISVG